MSEGKIKKTLMKEEAKIGTTEVGWMNWMNENVK